MYHGLLYTVIMLMSSATALLVARILWPKRDQPGAVWLLILMVAIAFWGVGNGMEAAAPDIPSKLFWSKVSYIGVTNAPPLFFIFALEFCLQSRWVTLRNLILLWIIPFATLIFAATNEFHHLIWTYLTPSPIAGSSMYIYHYGIWFWVGIIYAYILVVGSTAILFSAALRYRRLYHDQAIILLIAIPIPCIANIIYVSRIGPFEGYDFAPFAFLVTGAMIVLGVYRFRLLDLVPVTRDALIETMRDAVLVLDTQDRIVDMNPAFQKMMWNQLPIPIGSPSAEILSKWISPESLQSKSYTTEIFLKNTSRYYELTVSQIQSRNDHSAGKMVLFRDMTERKIAEKELALANERLQTQLEENQRLQDQLREQVVRDSLTGLFNRRYLDETLPREIARAQRDQTTVGLVMIDVDHFKQFNDQYGHQMGDTVLRQLAFYLKKLIRAGDFVSRFGGDEFVLVMPEVTMDAANQRAEEIREMFMKNAVSENGHMIQATFSAGVACYPTNGVTCEELLRAADHALYRAKENGRNRVEI